MNDLPKLFTMERYLFPLLEEELCELTAKMKEFLRIVEMIIVLTIENVSNLHKTFWILLHFV